MSAGSLRGRAAIIGFGDSYATADNLKTPLRLAAEATRAALLDAGLEKKDLDGLLVGRAPGADPRPQWNNIFAAYIKMTPRYASEVTIHAAGINSSLKHAAMAVTSGVARFVLCVNSDAAGLMDQRVVSAGIDVDPDFEQPYEPIIPAIYAQVACRLMHEYGVTEEDMAAVSVQCQEWGVLHPHAVKARKGRVTIEQVLGSRMIASPLRLWNCAPWGPAGTGGAVIVASAEDARAMCANPLYILGSAECQTHEYLTDRLALRSSHLPLGPLPSITSTGARVAGANAYEMAGLGPQDIDMLQTGSNFSHTQLMTLSELGFTTLPEAGAFVRSGATGFDGHIPTNTNGGWLSFGQPGVSCVMDSIIEGVRQLRGQALGKQVRDPEIAMIHALGGMMACHSVTILGKSA